MFDDEHDSKNYLINKRSIKLVLIWIVKIAILKIFIKQNCKEKIIVIGYMTVIYIF